MITCTFDDGGKGSLRHVCVDGLIVKDDLIALVKRSMKVTTEPGKLAIPGGYLDRDESILEGVKREVMEETGIIVHNGILFHIRDCPNNINDFHRQNVAFTYLFEDAETVKGKELDWDSESVQWFPFTQINNIKDVIAFDHWHIIKAYLEYREHKTQLPFWNAYLQFKK